MEETKRILIEFSVFPLYSFLGIIACGKRKDNFMIQSKYKWLYEAPKQDISSEIIKEFNLSLL